MLAEPEVLIKPNINAKLELGSEIPFKQVREEDPFVDWKFAGLKVNFHITPIGKKLDLKYSTEFTKPSDTGVSGSKEESNVRIRLNQPIKLFQISYDTNGRVATSTSP